MWTVSTARLSRLLQALDDTGEQDWTPVDGIDQLRSGLSASIRALPLADRTLDVTDVMAYPVVVPATTLSEKMSPLRFGGDKTAAVDYKMSMMSTGIQRHDAATTGSLRRLVGSLYGTIFDGLVPEDNDK